MGPEWPECQMKQSFWSGSTERRMELDTFGADHGKAGAYLLSLWGFDQDIVEAAAWHHTPGESTFGWSNALTVVYASNRFAHLNGGDTSSMDEWDWEYLTSRGVAGKIESWRGLADKVARGEE